MELVQSVFSSASIPSEEADFDHIQLDDFLSELSTVIPQERHPIHLLEMDACIHPLLKCSGVPTSPDGKPLLQLVEYPEDWPSRRRAQNAVNDLLTGRHCALFATALSGAGKITQLAMDMARIEYVNYFDLSATKIRQPDYAFDAAIDSLLLSRLLLQFQFRRGATPWSWMLWQIGNFVGSERLTDKCFYACLEMPTPKRDQLARIVDSLIRRSECVGRIVVFDEAQALFVASFRWFYKNGCSPEADSNSPKRYAHPSNDPNRRPILKRVLSCALRLGFCFYVSGTDMLRNSLKNLHSAVSDMSSFSSPTFDFLAGPPEANK